MTSHNFKNVSRFIWTRRGFLKSSALLAASGVISPAVRAVDTLLNPAHTTKPVSFRLGDLRVAVLEVGQFEMNTTELFPMATGDLRRVYGLERKPFIFKIHALYVDTGKNKIIIEPGGDNERPQRLTDELGRIDVDPAAIDTVIVTHAHFDHYNGCISANGQPGFMNARYYLQRKEWDYWLHDEDAEEYHVQRFKQILLPIEKQFVLINGDAEIIPGIQGMLTPGHSPGHMTVHIGKALAYTGDVLLQPVQIPYPDWVATWNRWPQLVVESRTKFLRRVAADGALVVGTHFPAPAMGHVTGEDGGWSWSPGL